MTHRRGRLSAMPRSRKYEDFAHAHKLNGWKEKFSFCYAKCRKAGHSACAAWDQSARLNVLLENWQFGPALRISVTSVQLRDVNYCRNHARQAVLCVDCVRGENSDAVGRGIPGGSGQKQLATMTVCRRRGRALWAYSEALCRCRRRWSKLLGCPSASGRTFLNCRCWRSSLLKEPFYYRLHTASVTRKPMFGNRISP